jgi:hypothetical protein
MASYCQCCGSAVSALLKACESFKEKQLFCFTISAAAKKFYAQSRSPAFSFYSCPPVVVVQQPAWRESMPMVIGRAKV